MDARGKCCNAIARNRVKSICADGNGVICGSGAGAMRCSHSVNGRIRTYLPSLPIQENWSHSGTITEPLSFGTWPVIGKSGNCRASVIAGHWLFPRTVRSWPTAVPMRMVGSWSSCGMWRRKMQWLNFNWMERQCRLRSPRTARDSLFMPRTR